METRWTLLAPTHFDGSSLSYNCGQNTLVDSRCHNTCRQNTYTSFLNSYHSGIFWDSLLALRGRANSIPSCRVMTVVRVRTGCCFLWKLFAHLAFAAPRLCCGFGGFCLFGTGGFLDSGVWRVRICNSDVRRQGADSFYACVSPYCGSWCIHPWTGIFGIFL